MQEYAMDVKASDILRKTIVASPLSLNELARRTGISAAALSRFVRGERSVSLTTFEALAAELKLRVVSTRKKR
jgi:transcriptional regulator with XRE-family HTH domain